MTQAILNEGRLVCTDEFYEVVQAADDEQELAFGNHLRELLAAAYDQHPVAVGMTQRLVNPDAAAPSWIEHEAWFGGPGAVAPAEALDEEA